MEARSNEEKIIESFMSLWFIEEEAASGLAKIVDVCSGREKAQSRLEVHKSESLRNISIYKQENAPMHLDASYLVGREKDSDFHLPLFRLLSAKDTLDTYGYDILRKWIR